MPICLETSSNVAESALSHKKRSQENLWKMSALLTLSSSIYHFRDQVCMQIALHTLYTLCETSYTLNHLKDYFWFSSIPWKCQKKCNGQKMRLDSILVRICLNFHFLASKWHLIASKYPKFAVPWKWRFPARPFYSQMQWAKNEIGLDSSQNWSKSSIFALKMALNCF